MRDATTRRFLTLSLANWALAIIAWAVSAYLGMTSPTSIFVYTVLFVVGLFAVVVGIAAFVVARFGAPAGSGVATEPADEPPAG
jgi:Ca2+/H+ antiporter